MAYRLSRAFAAAFISLAVLCAPHGASANFFWKAPDLRGLPMQGSEPGIGDALRGATPAEYRAALVWNLRAALNVAALQCQFDPTLLTLNQYNHLLNHHRAELATSFTTLQDFFKRTVKNPKAAQAAFDQYGTRTYSVYSTVLSQLTFCEAASKVGREAVFADKGQLHAVAEAYLAEMRNSLGRHGEQQFIFYFPPYPARFPSFEDRCWRGIEYQSRCPF